MDKRLAFPYGHTLVVYRIAYYGAAIVLILFFLAMGPDLPLLPVVLFGLLLGVVFLVFAVSPAWTDHWLTRSRVVLRQGWYFRAILPFSEIESLTPVDPENPLRAPLGLQRPFGQPTLYVTGSRTELVVARLRAPRRFWQAFGLNATEIVFDVADRAAFLVAYEERRRLLAPV